MKNKGKKKVHRDKNGREFIKEAYFIGGKMKFNRIYVINGISADVFYEKNTTDLDFYKNGDYELMSSEKDSDIYFILKLNENVKHFPFSISYTERDNSIKFAPYLRYSDSV